MLLALGAALSTPMERVLEPSNASAGPCQPCRFLKCPPLYDVHEDAELCQCECKLAPAWMEAKRIKKPCLGMKGCWLATNATRWDYYRVPKSGSTAMEAPLEACEAIRYHDHSDGCFESPDVCDASLLPDSRASFVVSRRPSDRFKSQFDHLHKRGEAQWVQWAKAYAPTQDTLLSYLESVFQGCTDDHCRVARIQTNFSDMSVQRHRVIFYPASYFFRESTSFICYDNELLSERYTEFMNQYFPQHCSAEPLARLNEDQR